MTGRQRHGEVDFDPGRGGADRAAIGALVNIDREAATAGAVAGVRALARRR